MQQQQLTHTLAKSLNEIDIAFMVAKIRSFDEFNKIGRSPWSAEELVVAFVERGFQVVKTAEETFINKNTVNSRIGKIEDLTGININRDFKQALDLYIRFRNLG